MSKCNCTSCHGAAVNRRQRNAFAAMLWAGANEWNAEAEDLPHRDSIAALAVADAMQAIAKRIDKGESPDDAVNAVLTVVADIEATLAGRDIEPLTVTSLDEAILHESNARYEESMGWVQPIIAGAN